MSAMDMFQVGFLAVVVIVGVGGMIIALRSDDEEK
jgi:hypothetical protein